MVKTICFAVLAWLSFIFPAFQQEPAAVKVGDYSKPATVFDQIYREDHPLEMTLETDFRNLMRNRRTNDYQPARLSYADSHGVQHDVEIEVRPRGKMRRNSCQYPPLKIRFPKENQTGKRTLKMVSVCNVSAAYQQLLLREYVAYRLYNILTGQSLRVQLVKVNFEDADEKSSPEDGFAFLIEHHDELAERHGGVILEEFQIPRRVLSSDEYERFCLFQFMLGNTDWLVYTGHNLKMFRNTATREVIFVPYDFDYSGFVDASYAVPDDRLKLPDVTDRYYLGVCRTEEQTRKNLQLFLDKKEEMLRFCEVFPYFNKHSRKHTLKYLNEFFDIIENPKKCERWILKNCDKWPNP